MSMKYVAMKYVFKLTWYQFLQNQFLQYQFLPSSIYQIRYVMHNMVDGILEA